MIKRWKILILIMAVIITVITGSLHYTILRTISINASVFDVSSQLSSLEKWKKWNPSIFNDKQKQIIKLKANTPVNFILERRDGSRASYQFINLRPLSAEDRSEVSWVASISGVEWLLEKASNRDTIVSQLKRLKKYMENPASFYGFPIQLVSVTDRTFCFYRKTVAKAEAQRQVPLMLQKLTAFLAEKGINNNSYYYVSCFPLAENTEVAVGMAVPDNILVGKGFDILKFPVGGRLLKGEFYGNPGDLKNVYRAMDSYIMHKHLSKVALPLERYAVKSPLNKGAIRVTVLYPVN